MNRKKCALVHSSLKAMQRKQSSNIIINNQYHHFLSFRHKTDCPFLLGSQIQNTTFTLLNTSKDHPLLATQKNREGDEELRPVIKKHPQKGR